jgi:hypothetical protein
MHRATRSLTVPGTLPAGADVDIAAVAALFLRLSGTEICGITRSSDCIVADSLSFSAAVTAALRVGMTLEAAVIGRGADADGAGGLTG